MAIYAKACYVCSRRFEILIMPQPRNSEYFKLIALRLIRVSVAITNVVTKLS
jgi:hypothetical protein